MSWKNDPAEHARIWHGAIQKVHQTLNKQDRALAFSVFTSMHETLLKGITDEQAISAFFNAWLTSCFLEDNTPLVPWFIQRFGEQLTPDEKEVLLAAHESWFGAYRVKMRSKSQLVLTDAAGRDFAVETASEPPFKEGATLLVRLVSKGPKRWFAVAWTPITDETLYDRLRAHRLFYDSWSDCLAGFFEYLRKEGLSERTADRHAENATLLTMFLEERADVDSFQKITKHMLSNDFKKFCEKCIRPLPEMCKVHYSLYLFFTYLKERKRKNNEEVLEWLRARIRKKARSRK